MKREVFAKMLKVGFIDWIIYIVMSIAIISGIIGIITIIFIGPAMTFTGSMLFVNMLIYKYRYDRYEKLLVLISKDAAFYETNVPWWNRFFSSTMFMPPNVRKRMLLNLYDKAVEVGKKKK